MPALRHALPLVGAALALALVLAAPAPAASLAGRLVDAGTGRPVEGARVRLLETGQAVRTGADGRFAFTDLPPGAYTLSTHHVAYADVERAVRAAGAGAGPVELALQPALYPAGEIVVRSARSGAPLRSEPWAVATLGRGELPGAPAITACDAAATLPGAALLRDGEGATALSIRGLGRSSIVALVDDARIETATDLSGGLALVYPEDLERVEVVKSAGSVLFGSGSLGGAVHMVTRRAAFAERARSGLEWSDAVTSADRGSAHHLALESASPRHALRVSAGYRRAGDVDTPLGRLPNSQWGDWTLNGSLGLRAGGRRSLVASYQRAQARDTGIPGGAPFPASAVATYTLARRELAALEYVAPNPLPRVTLVTARLWRQQVARAVEVRQGPALTLTPHAVHTTTGGALETRVAPGTGHALAAGAELWRRAVDSRRERHLWARDSTIGERPIPPASVTSAGLWAQDEWSPAGGATRLVAGARYDRSRTRNDLAWNPDWTLGAGGLDTAPPSRTVLWPAGTAWDHSWSASGGLHVELARALALSALLATAFRSPSLEERYQVLDLGSTVHVGDPSLAPERSVSLDVGARLGGEHAHVQANAFGNRLADLVAEVPGTYEGRPAWVETNVGRARLYGWELAAAARPRAHAALRGSLAYVRGEDTRAHANLAQVAPLSGGAELALEAPRAGTLRVAARGQHAQGNPGPGETRTPGWVAWDVHVAGAPIRVASGTVTLRGGVENLFDRAYRLHLSTLRGAVRLEPGRNAYLAATFAFQDEPGAGARP